MDAFPAFFPLDGKTVVIAGSGEAAEAKARLLHGSPARVVRVEGPKALAASVYQGALFAFITGDLPFCEAAREAAKAAGVLVSVVDRPQLSDFNTPAVIDRGAVVAAVGTAGAAPMLASLIRADIEARLPEGVGRVAQLLRGLQGEVRQAFPDLVQRRAFLRQAIAGPAARAAMDGDLDQAAQLLRAAIRLAPEAAAGRIRVAPGQGPAEFLTLRAARALAEADVLVADPDSAPEVLELVRRDAVRIRPEDAPAERLIELARTQQVVRLVTKPLDVATIRALTAGGVSLELFAASAH